MKVIRYEAPSGVGIFRTRGMNLDSFTGEELRRWIDLQLEIPAPMVSEKKRPVFFFTEEGEKRCSEFLGLVRRAEPGVHRIEADIPDTVKPLYKDKWQVAYKAADLKGIVSVSEGEKILVFLSFSNGRGESRWVTKRMFNDWRKHLALTDAKTRKRFRIADMKEFAKGEWDIYLEPIEEGR